MPGIRTTASSVAASFVGEAYMAYGFFGVIENRLGFLRRLLQAELF